MSQKQHRGAECLSLAHQLSGIGVSQRGELPLLCREEVIWNPNIRDQQDLDRGSCSGLPYTDPGARQPGFSTGSATHSLCDLQQVTYSLCVSVPLL